LVALARLKTFFLSLFYEGRINTFSPVTYLGKHNPFIKDRVFGAIQRSLPEWKI